MAVGHRADVDKIPLADRKRRLDRATQVLDAITDKYGVERIKSLWDKASDELEKEDTYAIKECIKEYLKAREAYEEAKDAEKV